MLLLRLRAAVVPSLLIFSWLLGDEATSVYAAEQESIVLKCSAPASNWRDALIGGNGIQGVMVHGKPLNETIVVNHEKCWVPAQPIQPDVSNMVQANKKARELAWQENWRGGDAIVFNAFGNSNDWDKTSQDWKNFPKEMDKKPITTPTIEHLVRSEAMWKCTHTA